MNVVEIQEARRAYAWSDMTSFNGQRELFTMATDILDQAIMMGNHPIDYDDRHQSGALATGPKRPPSIIKIL